jgi:hypothetical protein
MSTQKSTSSTSKVAQIEFLLEQYGLPHYRWQAVLHLIRAGNKEGIPELDDVNAALNYLRRDVASLQKAKRNPASGASRSRSRSSKPASKANSAAPSGPSPDEAQATA